MIEPETIAEGARILSAREQKELVRLAYEADPTLWEKRAEALRRTYGALNEEDGEIFEQALKDSRRI